MKPKGKMSKSLLVKSIFLQVVLFFGTFCYASEYFYIKNYKVDVFVSNTSVLDIEETIDVEFTSRRHGIFRTIPYKYFISNNANSQDRAWRPNLGGKTYKIDIYSIAVEGEKFTTYKKGNNIVVKIGDKNRYVYGGKRYKIKYKVFGAINFFKDSSEFYYNIIGNEWPVRIESANFNIFWPTSYELSHEDLILAGGFYSEKEQVANYQIVPGGISGNTVRVLNPREGLTIVARFPGGYLKNGSLFLRIKLFILNNFPFLTIPVLFLLLFFIWLKLGRDNSIINYVQYAPPKGMTPSEAGIIIDDKTDNRDLISIIFYWAVNGIIKIEEEKGEVFFEKDDYILSKQKDLPEDAKLFERTMFEGLFPAQTQVVRISSLKNRFYTYLREARSQLDQYIGSSGAYVSGSRELGKILKYSGIIFIIAGFFLSSVTGNFAYLIAFIINGIIAFIFGYLMPKKSDAGLVKFQHIKGLKEFMEKVEKPKLKMLLKDDPSYFDKTIPFAVALGVEASWGEKFKDLITEAPEWYTPSEGHLFSTVHMTSSISNSTRYMGQVFSSVPSSSGSGGGSGFGGGGGFSGGGFGGGGGGSW